MPVVNLQIEVNDKDALWLGTASSKDVALAISFGRTIVSEIDAAVEGRIATTQKQKLSADLPVVKGQIGEEFVQSVLAKNFGDVANVAHSAKSGDLTLFVKHRKIIVEVKNYSNNVPTSQVEKFQRDLSTTNACGGVFISLKTPITGISDNFAIRYEYADTKTIPCAYVVSDDESAIILAVNMIVQQLQSLDYIHSEMYNRDKIISSVYEIADRLDDVSKARNDLQVNIGDITSKLMKTSLGLATAESGIRRGIDDIRGELFHSHHIDHMPMLAELEKNTYFSKQNKEIKGFVEGVMKHIYTISQKNNPLKDIQWKLSTRKCVNSQLGIGFNIGATISVTIPRTRIQSELIIKSLDMFGKKVSVDDCLCIDLDSLTYGWIIELIQ